MKKILFIALLAAFGMNAKAQITLEHDYPGASTYSYALNQLIYINFAVSGERYVLVDRTGKSMNIYNLNHALVKTISLAALPIGISDSGEPGDILYISQHLFSLDTSIEFVYIQNSAVPTQCCLGIYNESGTLLFTDSAGMPIRDNVPLQQYPIYNTSEGTKMILSYPNGHAKVFSLLGTLTTSIQEANNNLIAAQRQGNISNPYPNPNNNSTKIDYELPQGINEGEIVFYNLQGAEVKRFKVDRTFNTLLISTSDLAAGTYLYQLQTSAQSSEGKKMVVIK